MLRLSTLAARRLGGLRSQHLLGLRHASSGGGGGGGGGVVKLVAGTVVLTAGIGGGAVGYAAVDTDFRKSLEDTVPGSNELLDMVLGPPAPPPAPKPVPPSKLKIPGPVVITKPKDEPVAASPPPVKQEKPKEVVKEAPKKEEPAKAVEPTPAPEPVVPAVPEPPIELPPEPEKPAEPEIPAVVEAVEEPKPAVVEELKPAVVEEPKPAVVEEPKQTVAEVEPVVPAALVAEFANEELTPDVENSSLEQVLIELCKEMQSATGLAVESYEMSSDAVISHINIMQKVLESNLAARDDDAWNQVFEAATAKSEALKFAGHREKEANAAISNVVESIDAGRKNKTTSTNPQLIVAEEAVNRALYQLEQAKARISAVEGEARVMEQYRDLIEEGRQQFHREMASIMPDVKIGEKENKLTEDELNMFITHAYRKVLFLQQELAKQQTLEQQRFKQALEKQRVEAQLAASDKIDTELERQKRDLEVEHQRKLVALKEEAEGELRTQLRRQAAAHSDHLSDVLTVQEAELRRKHEHILDEQLSAAESDYLGKLAGYTGNLNGLTAALEARAAGDREALAAQKLWLACAALKNSIHEGNSEATSFDESTKPLKSDVSYIKSLAGDNEFVSSVLGGIPEVALSRGVYTEQALRDRFCRVHDLANKVGFVGDEGASLFRYGLSYLQSKLLVDTSSRTPGPNDQPLDVDQVTTADILALSKYSLERGDLLQAVQYMGLLKGEPRKVAKDWLSEARLLLEAQQASEALVAHAAAVGLEVLPK